VASVLLYFLIFLFYVQSKKKFTTDSNEKLKVDGIASFIKIKKVLAASLVPVIVILAAYSFINWFSGTFNSNIDAGASFKDINNIFFEQFFTILIIADVFLLLFSFFHTDEFHKVIRNSGFIISTILIRLSFSVSGLLNTVLIISAIIFGLLILIIHNKFEAHIASEREN
jgi:hypothetical protein